MMMTMITMTTMMGAHLAEDVGRVDAAHPAHAPLLEIEATGHAAHPAAHPSPAAARPRAPGQALVAVGVEDLALLRAKGRE
jgi:hypothetical protein